MSELQPNSLHTGIAGQPAAEAAAESSAAIALSRWVSGMIVVCAALMIAGALIALFNPAMLVGSEASVNSAARIYAGYLVSRNLAMAFMLLSTLAISARRPLTSVLVLAALVQLLDGAIDLFEARWAVAPGVVVLGALLIVAANVVARGRLYTVDFWRDCR